MAKQCKNLLVVDARSGHAVTVNISASIISQFDDRKPLERVFATPKRMGTIIGVGEKPDGQRLHKEYLWVALDGDAGRVCYFTYDQVKQFNTGRNTCLYLDQEFEDAGKEIEDLLYQSDGDKEYAQTRSDITAVLKRLEMRPHEITLSHGEFAGQTLLAALVATNEQYWRSHSTAP